jgi:putative redox protein
MIAHNSTQIREGSMAKELTAAVVIREGLHVVGHAASGATVQLDVPGAPADCGGTPMELLLVSLAGCAAMDVISYLRKQNQAIADLEVRVRAQRRDEHPRVFTHIHLEFVAHGTQIDLACATRAIEQARSHYCPIWAMLAASVTISDSLRLLDSAPLLIPAD